MKTRKQLLAEIDVIDKLISESARTFIDARNLRKTEALKDPKLRKEAAKQHEIVNKMLRKVLDE